MDLGPCTSLRSIPWSWSLTQFRILLKLFSSNHSAKIGEHIIWEESRSLTVNRK